MVSLATMQIKATTYLSALNRKLLFLSSPSRKRVGYMTEDLISMMSAVDDGTRTNVPPELLQESLHFLTLGLFKWLRRA